MYGTLENNDKSQAEGTGAESGAALPAFGPPDHQAKSQAAFASQTGETRRQSRRGRKIFSHCHIASDESGGAGVGSNEAPSVDKSARRRLIVASVICLLFMIGEIVGGLLSGSLAIATDAAHLLTDFASFMISLFAIWLSSRPASRKMSFGWYRAEVIGALLSVLMIWLVTGLLVYMAVERLRTGDFEIDATVMVVTAAAGLLVNIIMAIALNVDGHGHGHGHFHAHAHGHAHGHEHHNHNHNHEHDIRGHSHLVHMHDNELDHDERTPNGTLGADSKEADLMRRSLIQANDKQTRASHLDELSLAPGLQEAPKKLCKGPAAGADQHHGRGRTNINVRAAFIHVIGDFLQSLGVLIAALVIYFEPSYAIVDPICTFLFSIIVLVTTLNIIRDATNVLMEGIPDGIKFIEVRDRLHTLPGVVKVHNLRIWSLSLDKIAISTHLVIDTNQVSSAQALKRAIETLKSGYRFFEVTIQIEEFREDMKDCGQCQEEEDELATNTPDQANSQQNQQIDNSTGPTRHSNSDGSPA